MSRDRKDKGAHGVLETVMVKRDGVEVEINKCDISKEGKGKKDTTKEGKGKKDKD